MLIERGECSRTICEAQGFEGTPRLLLQRLIVLIERVDVFGRAAKAGFAEPGEHGFSRAFAFEHNFCHGHPGTSPVC
jgi:hypothetical protein